MGDALLERGGAKALTKSPARAFAPGQNGLGRELGPLGLGLLDSGGLWVTNGAGDRRARQAASLLCGAQGTGGLAVVELRLREGRLGLD